MRPENNLLLRLLKSDSGAEGPTPLPCGVSQGLDWNRFVNLCDWHGVVPRLYRGLQTVSGGIVPQPALKRLREVYHARSARVLFLATELSKITAAFDERGIPTYPFKGPALSVMLYGDPARRQSNDLDILVPREKVGRAKQTLEALGYHTKTEMDSVRLAAHRRTEYEIAFSRRDGRLMVELQWAVVPGFFGFDHERLDIWSNLKKQSGNGFAFPMLPPEETLLLLSVHGAKHLWCKLGWVCDVADLLDSPAPPDLSRTLELAERCGVTRLLHLGLLLAERLAGARLPQEVSARIDADLMAASMARQCQEVIAKSPVNPDVDPRRYLFYLKSKDRRRDQLLFVGKLMVTLAAGEWNPSAFPDVLSPLYYLFRPLHMAGRHSGPILRAMARK
jgi:hypothetical protein